MQYSVLLLLTCHQLVFMKLNIAYDLQIILSKELLLYLYNCQLLYQLFFGLSYSVIVKAGLNNIKLQPGHIKPGLKLFFEFYQTKTHRWRQCSYNELRLRLYLIQFCNKYIKIITRLKKIVDFSKEFYLFYVHLS